MANEIRCGVCKSADIHWWTAMGTCRVCLSVVFADGSPSQVNGATVQCHECRGTGRSALSPEERQALGALPGPDAILENWVTVSQVANGLNIQDNAAGQRLLRLEMQGLAERALGKGRAFVWKQTAQRW